MIDRSAKLEQRSIIGSHSARTMRRLFMNYTSWTILCVYITFEKRAMPGMSRRMSRDQLAKLDLSSRKSRRHLARFVRVASATVARVMIATFELFFTVARYTRLSPRASHRMHGGLRFIRSAGRIDRPFPRFPTYVQLFVDVKATFIAADRPTAAAYGKR
jgi:hypothetical protein